MLGYCFRFEREVPLFPFMVVGWRLDVGDVVNALKLEKDRKRVNALKTGLSARTGVAADSFRGVVARRAK